jgi:hypothetical protein
MDLMLEQVANAETNVYYGQKLLDAESRSMNVAKAPSFLSISERANYWSQN